MIQIYPSLIACSISKNISQVDKLDNCIKSTEPFSAGYHIDIMDNKFVPNSSWSPEEVNIIRTKTDKPFFIHLMVENPQNYLDLLNLNNKDTICFHVETHDDHNNLLKKIHEKNLLASLALKPKTLVESILNYIHDIDHVLLMSVEPGFSGQEFLLQSFDRFKALKSLKDLNQAAFKIGLDGGINKTNIKEISDLGADDVAIGSAIFGSSTPEKSIKELYDIVHEDKDIKKLEGA